MVAYGYLAYLIRVAPLRRTRRLQRLSSVGSDERDLLSEVAYQLDALGTKFYRNSSMAEGYRFNDYSLRGRSLRLKLRRGPVGNPGETFKISSDESTETDEDTALLSELRAAFYVPRDSYYGFLFVERIGGRHAKDLIYQKIVVPIADNLMHVVRTENYAEVSDWERVLSGQQVLRVSEVLRPDSSHDASTPSDTFVRVSVEGGGVSTRSDELKQRFLDVVDRTHQKYRVLADIAPFEARRLIWATVKKRNGAEEMAWKPAPKESFTVADKAEFEALKARLEALESGVDNSDIYEELQDVLPIERGEYESRRLEVTFGEDRPEKTFVVTGDKVPQLVYEFGGRLLDSDLWDTWDTAAHGFLTRLNVQLGPGWPVEAANTD